MINYFQIPFKEVFKEEFRFFRQFSNNVKVMQTRKSSSQLESVNGSNGGSRSRSSGAVNNNNENIGFRLSLKNLNKISREDDFEKI